MNIHSKEPMEMSGALVCEFFDLMVSKAQRGWNKCARLFHQPLEQPFYGARHWFDQQVHGKSFTTTAVSKYAAMLRLLDPTFPRHKFTNGSVRKCHTYVLNMSNLPASVQQKSLGHISARGSQLWRTTYNNPADPTVRSAVATTIENTIQTDPATPPPKRQALSPLTRSATKKIAHGTIQQPASPHHGTIQQTVSPQQSAAGISISIPSTHGTQNISLQLPPGSVVKLTLPGGACMQFTY